MSAPRVLIAASVLGQPMGGVRRHNAELLPRVARLLAEQGGALAVLEGRTPIPFALPAEVERIPSRVPASPALVRAAFETRALENALALARAAGRPFDLVHTAHLPAPRALSVPFTLTLHDLRSLDLEHTSPWRGLFAPRIVARAVRDARGLIAVSQSVRAELLLRFGLAPERVSVVPNAADHLAVLPRAPNAAARLLHVGHVEPRKNLALLVRALAHDAELPALDLAGAAPPGERARLERLARELGVHERVAFLGPFDDAVLPALYARAACVVLPSRLEGFGIPALEAQRARAPLAISRTPALVEVAGGRVPNFSPDDPRECAAAIRTALARDSAELEHDARAADRFRWDTSAEAWIAALSAALADRVAPSSPPSSP